MTGLAKYTRNIAPFRVALRRTVCTLSALRLIASIIHLVRDGGRGGVVAKCSLGAVPARSRWVFHVRAIMPALFPSLLVAFPSRSAVSLKEDRTRRRRRTAGVPRCNEISAHLFAYTKGEHDLIQLSGETVVKSKPSSLNRHLRHRSIADS